jgi:Cellulase (glycosyl hydrolase family 5)
MTYWLARAKSSMPLAVLLGLLAIINSSCGVLHYQRRVSLATAARGVNADISSMISGTPYSITTTSGGNFFDLAAQLGINTLRITDMQWEMKGKEYPQSSWRYVFDEAADHHINIILLLMAGNGHPANQQAYTLLGTYGLAQSHALWMVDLYNEPDLSDPQVMAALSNEAAYVRQVAPSAYVTIGGWKSQVPGHPGEFDWEDPADIPGFINLVDVVSPHLYGFDQETLPDLTPQRQTRDYLSAVRRVSQGKPILLEEFGASNGLATTTSNTATGSIAWQASVYRGVLQEVAAEHDQGVIGALAWIMAPRPAWPNDLQGDMTGWAFVLDHGHRLLSAANAFSSAARP